MRYNTVDERVHLQPFPIFLIYLCLSSHRTAIRLLSSSAHRGINQRKIFFPSVTFTSDGNSFTIHSVLFFVAQVGLVRSETSAVIRSQKNDSEIAKKLRAVFIVSEDNNSDGSPHDLIYRGYTVADTQIWWVFPSYLHYSVQCTYMYTFNHNETRETSKSLYRGNENFFFPPKDNTYFFFFFFFNLYS